MTKQSIGSWSLKELLPQSWTTCFRVLLCETEINYLVYITDVSGLCLLQLNTVSAFRILAVQDNKLPVQQAVLLFNNTQFPPYTKVVVSCSLDLIYSLVICFGQ